MAFGATEALTSIFPSYTSSSSSSHKLHSFNPCSLRFHISLSAPSLKLIALLPSSQPTTSRHGFQLRSAVESATAEEQIEKLTNPDSRRKLYVRNLPWSYSVADIKKLFGECGTVEDVEIIKQKNGKSRGFAFLTMASAEEARAAIEKYDNSELVGRIIRVEFAKRFKKPIRKVPIGPPPIETRYLLYVSNLAWKVRSSNLREFFTSGFNPVSARVVFDSPSGKSAGYGFVSFATKEEAESAISALDGKELLGRPIRLRFSEKKTESDTASDNKEQEESSEQPNEEISSEQPKEEESSEQPQES